MDYRTLRVLSVNSLCSLSSLYDLARHSAAPQESYITIVFLQSKRWINHRIHLDNLPISARIAIFAQKIGLKLADSHSV